MAQWDVCMYCRCAFYWVRFLLGVKFFSFYYNIRLSLLRVFRHSQALVWRNFFIPMLKLSAVHRRSMLPSLFKEYLEWQSLKAVFYFWLCICNEDMHLAEMRCTENAPRLENIFAYGDQHMDVYARTSNLMHNLLTLQTFSSITFIYLYTIQQHNHCVIRFV